MCCYTTLWNINVQKIAMFNNLVKQAAMPLKTGWKNSCPVMLALFNSLTARMWANAKCDDRPAEYRWRPLFNAAKFGWRLLLQCSAVTLPRRETRWNLQGWPKLPDGSQPLVGRSSPYCGDMWRRYCCLTTLFPIVDTSLNCEDIGRQSCAMVPRWRLWWFFGSCISSEPRTARVRPAGCILNSH